MTDEDNTTRQVSADGESGVHRLRDIVVEEVSLVDRAANKRRFLVVKRSSEMADDGKSKDRSTTQEGGASAARREPGKKPKHKAGENVDKARPRVTHAASEEDEEDKEDEEEEREKARRSRSSSEDEEEDDEVDAAKVADEENELDEDEEDDDEDDEEATSSRDEHRQGRNSKQTQKAEGDELILSAAVKNAVLRVLAQALERLMAVANQVKEADAPDDDTDVSVPDDLTGELEDIGELLEDIGEQLSDPGAKADDKKPGAAKGRAAKADVAKAGRRMAKDRLDRFQKALEALSSILKELTAAKEAQAPKAASATNPLAKRDAMPEVVAGLQELTRVVKQREEQLVQMRKTRATSNAIPVEGGSRQRGGQDVSWPLDMNRPITRDRVDKAISFYDEE